MASLIYELNEMIRDKDPVELAMDDVRGRRDDLEDFDGSDEFDVDVEPVELSPELQRIADYWAQEGSDMSNDDLRDAIGDELEQLDYSPEDIATGLEQIMQYLDREEQDGDEYSEYEDEDDDEYGDEDDDEYGDEYDDRV